MKYERIFREVKIGNITLKNRTISQPISTNFARKDGHLTDRFIKHYVRRANGGVALVTVENSSIDYPEGRHGAFQPRIDSSDFIPHWKRLVGEVIKYGVKIAVELTHPGYKDKYVDSIPESKIKELINKYRIAAKQSKGENYLVYSLTPFGKCIFDTTGYTKRSMLA